MILTIGAILWLLLLARLLWFELVYWQLRHTTCDCQHQAGCPLKEE